MSARRDDDDRTRTSPSALLRVLADPLRAAIVAALATERLCTCHLVEITGSGQTNVSNHLRILRDAGLVTAEPAGRYTYYRLLPGPLYGLAEHLTALADTAQQHRGDRRPCP